MRGDLKVRHYHLTPLEIWHRRALPPLQNADIVLVRHKKNFTRALVRYVTGSYWDHAALVIFKRDPRLGYSANIIIEAIQHGANSSFRRGVELHRLDKYLMRPELYDVGIKRFSWLTDKFRDRARAYMLLNVDTPYYPLSTTKFLFAVLSRRLRELLNSRQRYSCSGLVQKAFYEAVDWNMRPRVTFKPFGNSPIEVQELTSPADIARSDVCDWIWNKR